MLTLEQIQKDIQELPEEAQNLLIDFVEILKKRYSKPAQTETTSEKSTYQKFKESGFIGCVSVEENLSTTYKQVLSEELSAKYDHR
jgi:mRNA-degrading endonuclease RelE of RelBE toxin-antitoxin system